MKLDRLSIEQQPEIINQRKRVGDLEGDLIVGAGKSGYIVTLVERKSLHCRAVWVPTRHAQTVADAIISILEPLKGKSLYSIIFDNGTEFAAHKDIAKALNITVYFARPYCSIDRTRNENTNRLMRRYFPKKTSFANIESQQL